MKKILFEIIFTQSSHTLHQQFIHNRYNVNHERSFYEKAHQFKIKTAVEEAKVFELGAENKEVVFLVQRTTQCEFLFCFVLFLEDSNVFVFDTRNTWFLGKQTTT